MKKSVLLFYLAFCSIVIGQNKGLLRGFVADSTSGEMLPYANVYIQEVKRGASTDHRGFFIMASLPHDIILTVKISYIGFESKELIIRVEPYGVTDIKVLLVPASIQLQTIEKIGEKVAKGKCNRS